jgi:preprotein translocase subunit SecY
MIVIFSSALLSFSKCLVLCFSQDKLSVPWLADYKETAALLCVRAAARCSFLSLFLAFFWLLVTLSLCCHFPVLSICVKFGTNLLGP